MKLLTVTITDAHRDILLDLLREARNANREYIAELRAEGDDDIENDSVIEEDEDMKEIEEILGGA